MRLRVSKWSTSWAEKSWRRSKMSNAAILTIFILSVTLFFWGAYKAANTQKKIYLLAFLPFLLLIAGMFLL